jgi:hypothetical protein
MLCERTSMILVKIVVRRLREFLKFTKYYLSWNLVLSNGYPTFNNFETGTPTPLAVSLNQQYSAFVECTELLVKVASKQDTRE